MPVIEIYGTGYEIKLPPHDKLYVVEIQHNGTPCVWRCDNEPAFISRVASLYNYYSDIPDGDNFEEWREYLARDLRELHVLTPEEAIKYCKGVKEGSHVLLKLLEEDKILMEIFID